MKQTPIQKAIEYCQDECVAMRNYLQSLLAEERQMVEDAYNAGYWDYYPPTSKYAGDSENYFTQTYQQ